MGVREDSAMMVRGDHVDKNGKERVLEEKKRG